MGFIILAIVAFLVTWACVTILHGIWEILTGKMRRRRVYVRWDENGNPWVCFNKGAGWHKTTALELMDLLARSK